jgi:hypothetical protein
VAIRLDRALLALPFEQGSNLRPTETAVASGRADAADPAGRSPTGHGLGVDAEQCRHLARRQETISSVHDPLLASTVPGPAALAEARVFAGT